MIPFTFALISTIWSVDSLSSQVEMIVQTPEVNQSADFELYFEKTKGIRMEMSVLGFTAASAFANDSSWALNLPMENLVLVGYENWIPLGDPQKAPWINPKNLLPLMWGDTSLIDSVFRSIQKDSPPLTHQLGEMVPCASGRQCPKWVQFSDANRKFRLRFVKRDFSPHWKNSLWQWTPPVKARWMEVPRLSEIQAENLSAN